MLHNIQALRATAALLVVIVHLEVIGAPLGLESAFFNLFAVGVDLFFVISGFIMVHTTSRRDVTPSGFLLNRLVRIAPLYWLLTLLVFAVALTVPGALGGTRADWDALVRSLAFIPYERADGTMRPMLFVGWSLNLEMAFYAVFALALTVAGIGRRVALAVAVLGLAVAVHVWMGSRLPVELRFLTQPILLEFAAGMAIGWLYPQLPADPSAGRWAVGVGLAALVALVMVARWPLPGGWPISLPPACVVVIAALIAEKAGYVLRWRPIQVLGDASYALYLTHPFVTQAWTLLAVKAHALSPRTAPVLMVAAVLSAIAAGVVAHYRVEQPLGRLTRRWTGRLAHQRSAFRHWRGMAQSEAPK